MVPRAKRRLVGRWQWRDTRKSFTDVSKPVFVCGLLFSAWSAREGCRNAYSSPCSPPKILLLLLRLYNFAHSAAFLACYALEASRVCSREGWTARETILAATLLLAYAPYGLSACLGRKRSGGFFAGMELLVHVHRESCPPSAARCRCFQELSKKLLLATGASVLLQCILNALVFPWRVPMVVIALVQTTLDQFTVAVVVLYGRMFGRGVQAVSEDIEEALVTRQEHHLLGVLEARRRTYSCLNVAFILLGSFASPPAIALTLSSLCFTVGYLFAGAKGTLPTAELVAAYLLILVRLLNLIILCCSGQNVSDKQRDLAAFLKRLQPSLEFDGDSGTSAVDGKALLFLKSVQRNPSRMTAGGYFDLDRKFIVQVATTMTIYVLVVLQFPD